MKRFGSLYWVAAFAVLAAGALVTAPALLAGPETAQPTKRPLLAVTACLDRFGAPLIAIALNHKSELNLTTDQVARGWN